MTSDKSLQLNCPECGAEIVADAATGQILYHKKVQGEPAGGRTLESLMKDAAEAKNRSEEIFEREKAALKDRDRLLEQRFNEAMSRADELDDKPLLREIDLD